MEWPTSSRVRARPDGNVSAGQIALLTGLQVQSVIGNLSDLKFYGRPNVARLGFTWQTGRYGQCILRPARAVVYVRQVLLPIMRRRGGRVGRTELFLDRFAIASVGKAETARDERILAAMRTYTGPRGKRQGWPFLWHLRAHAGMRDITHTDRRRLWQRVTRSEAS